MRKEFLDNKNFLGAFELNKILKTHEFFQALPAKTSQQIIISLGNNWNSYFKSIKKWSKNKEMYTGKPNLPQRKDKRYIVFFDYTQNKPKDGRIYFQTKRNETKINYIETNITEENFRQLRIVPQATCYKIEI
jgi:putative transposase